MHLLITYSSYPYSNHILHIIILHMLHIVHFKSNVYIFPARINDGCDVDNWHVEDYSTGSSISLWADRWYRQAQASGPKSNSGDFAGIRINI